MLAVVLAVLATGLTLSVTPRSGYQIAHLTAPVELYRFPGAAPLAAVGTRTEFGSPQTLTVVARRGGWSGVISSRTANNRLAWVKLGPANATLRTTRLRLVVSLSGRRLQLERGLTVVRTLTVGVGSSATPTPMGRFAITDKLPGVRFSPSFGASILALNGHQTRLPLSWRGGDRLAIHGTNASWTIGAAVSAGCLHAGNAGLRYLTANLPLGTLVLIRR
jgi:hypothetical protein